MCEKLDKKISSTRNYSRRYANLLIKSNKVKVNDIITTQPNVLVKPNDTIKINDKILHFGKEPIKVWLFNKPPGLLSTKTDPKNRPTIYTALPKKLKKFLYVGRLDFNSEGLLILTNNGPLVHYMTNAKNNFSRTYKVKTFGKITQAHLNKLQKGITINNIKYRNIKANIITQNNFQTWISFTLLEGKNNEIRKLCQYFNLQVSRLIRIQFGPFALNKLPKGQVKEIPPTTLKRLFPFLFNT